jgi:hypothetical protein
VYKKYEAHWRGKKYGAEINLPNYFPILLPFSDIVLHISCFWIYLPIKLNWTKVIAQIRSDDSCQNYYKGLICLIWISKGHSQLYFTHTVLHNYLQVICEQTWSYELHTLRLHYMMKTLISSFFTFLLIYIQGLEFSQLQQVFFKNIKMRPKYNKKYYNYRFFCSKSCDCNWQYVDRCDTQYRMCDLQPCLCLRGAWQIFYWIFVWPT